MGRYAAHVLDGHVDADEVRWDSSVAQKVALHEKHWRQIVHKVHTAKTQIAHRCRSLTSASTKLNYLHDGAHVDARAVPKHALVLNFFEALEAIGACR
tara:strand:+ start:325 stop:618 length:294 start_codon:yes stop_codon:yes gene_type:complete